MTDDDAWKKKGKKKHWIERRKEKYLATGESDC